MREVNNVLEIEFASDSRLLYEKRMPWFGYILLLLVTVSLVTVIIWSIRTPKVDVITSQGSVQSINKNYVMTPYVGEILSVYYAEGDWVEKGEPILVVKSTDLNLQKEQLTEQKAVYEKQVAQYNKLVLSIQQDSNLFDANEPSDNLYYSQYEIYKSQINQLKLDTTTLKAYGYTDEQIAEEAEKNQWKVAEIYYSTITSAENQILQAQTQIGVLDSQLDAIESGREDYVVTATETGTLHLLGEYKEGMIVQAGTAVASIASENARYKIIATISVNDYPKIEVGNEVDILPLGLSQTLYGTIRGQVIKIDSDITVPQSEGENSIPYFKVEIEPDVSYIISKEGRKVNLSNGMIVEAHIVYDEETYFNYVLESLGILTRK
jgi:multidrug efflux pump subunit AcrA (membrane-fusion protein)